MKNMKNMMLGMLNEASNKKLLESIIPKCFQSGMKIPPGDREKRMMGTPILQETYTSIIQGNNHDEFIGFLIGMILSWEPEVWKTAISKLADDWFKYLNRTDYREDVQGKNRITAITLVLYVLNERMKENVTDNQ